MEQIIRDAFTDSVLGSALKQYQIQPENAQILDGFESYIYNVHKGADDFILRIGHDSRRSPELVQGEAEFLNHLSKGGLRVPRVLPSVNGRLVERIQADNGTHFLTTLFTKAPGHPPKGDDWNETLFRAMGAFMGKLHDLSRDFQPSQPRFARFDIEHDFEEVIATGRKYLPPEDEAVLKAYSETINAIRKLPKSPDVYGLCHIDFHGGNFFITNAGEITLFDFDDCQYAWFIYDIAMALFYAISHNCQQPNELEKAERFLSAFWAGYSEEYPLDPWWLSQIPLFLRLREIDLYLAIHRSMDLEDLDDWCASYMDGRREKILNNIPYCNLNYE